MSASDIESWTFGRSTAAEIIDRSEGQLANWINRYDPTGKARGRGHHIAFNLSDLMTLAAMGLLIDIGLEPAKAADALRPYGSPYASLLHDYARNGGIPGVFFLTQSKEGRWVATDGPDKPVRIELRSWAIFDEIYPRFRSAILNSPNASERVIADIESFEANIEKLRLVRWGE